MTALSPEWYAAVADLARGIIALDDHMRDDAADDPDGSVPPTMAPLPVARPGPGRRAEDEPTDHYEPAPMWTTAH